MLGNGLLKHVSEVMTETVIRRQRVQKSFRYNGKVKIVQTATKTRFDDNSRNEQVYGCTECFISGRRKASLGRENWPEEDRRDEILESPTEQ
jgi:predicted SprT family Zn-dependent metalloprotease